MKLRLFLSAILLASCANLPGSHGGSGVVDSLPNDPVGVLNRITWGISGPAMGDASTQGLNRYVNSQLRPGGDTRVPEEVQAEIESLTVGHEALLPLMADLQGQRKAADAIPEGPDRMAAQHAYQDQLNHLARDAVSRDILRALYGRDQLQEQMVWFWLNHFSVYKGKSDLRAFVGDYEEEAIRPHALGHFHELLRATVFHPAMLRYLDNDQNAAGHINENYAREIMELHTLGVEGGYTQHDVQELARILTGLGVNLSSETPKLGRQHAADYFRDGAVEFNPNRHDYGDKLFLGHKIHGAGLAEVDEVIDILSRHPATAHFVSRKLATFLVADEPSPALVERMAQAFLAGDGDISQTLRVAIYSRELAASLGQKFRDPIHYVVAAVRLAYGGKVILNTGPVINWLDRMGQPLYGHPTPEGYPLTQSGWASPGQLTTRFEIAKAIGNGSAGLFRSEGEQPVDRPAFPQLANAIFYQSLEQRLGAATRKALDQAGTPQEWNLVLLASPDMMYH